MTDEQIKAHIAALLNADADEAAAKAAAVALLASVLGNLERIADALTVTASAPGGSPATTRGD